MRTELRRIRILGTRAKLFRRCRTCRTQAHIGQTVNARAYACATCRALQTFVARRCKGRGFRKIYC